MPALARVGSEAFGFLVVPPVFKIGEVEQLDLAGSIPVRLRQTDVVSVRRRRSMSPAKRLRGGTWPKSTRAD